MSRFINWGSGEKIDIFFNDKQKVCLLSQPFKSNELNDQIEKLYGKKVSKITPEMIKQKTQLYIAQMADLRKEELKNKIDELKDKKSRRGKKRKPESVINKLDEQFSGDEDMIKKLHKKYRNWDLESLKGFSKSDPISLFTNLWQHEFNEKPIDLFEIRESQHMWSVKLKSVNFWWSKIDKTKRDAKKTAYSACLIALFPYLANQFFEKENSKFEYSKVGQEFFENFENDDSHLIEAHLNLRPKYKMFENFELLKLHWESQKFELISYYSAKQIGSENQNGLMSFRLKVIQKKSKIITKILNGLDTIKMIEDCSKNMLLTLIPHTTWENIVRKINYSDKKAKIEPSLKANQLRQIEAQSQNKWSMLSSPKKNTLQDSQFNEISNWTQNSTVEVIDLSDD